MNRSILVVDDEESLRRINEVRLTQAGYSVGVASTAEAALGEMQRQRYDLVISDLRMPGASGLDLLKRIRADYPDAVVVLMTAFGTVETAVQAMKLGAYDYLTKPIDGEELLLTVARALEHAGLREEVRTLRASLNRKYGFESLIGESRELLYVLDVASRAAASETTVLIHGETGTGKELLAKAIHFNSPRRDRPFVAINCGAIPRDLLESELFGHMRGAFTGAVAHKRGKVETAEGGTLFLDEIGELTADLQVKILRLVQEREIEKVGSLEVARVNVRLIAATNRKLQAMVEDGTFRQDLFYRLSVIPLDLPPLRERMDDIPALVENFFLRAKEKAHRPELVLPQQLVRHFSGYRWPGNVRELENMVERIVVLARGNEITLEDLPPNLRQEPAASNALQLELPETGISLEGVEKELIVRALKKFDWNQSQAARYLDISRRTLIYRMEKFGLSRERAAAEEPTRSS
jgi:two-component system NtrC family response regulator